MIAGHKHTFPWPAGLGVCLNFEKWAKTSGPANALADNANRNANALAGEQRFHGSLYRFHNCVRQAFSTPVLNVSEAAKQFSIKVYELATDLSQSVPMCPAGKQIPAPKQVKAKKMSRKVQASQSEDLLSCHYHAIGSAAILAALICCARERTKSGLKTA